ncbi:MAG: response regulator transcription factor [Clostridiales bacterium]|jgi:DNA-binding response OmpR family regulator|nr:response regulator transcription factor [Clostridiales bacterium]
MGKTVLLVEDNEKLNEANCRALRLEGYDALAAPSLRDARECLAKRRPEVILLDALLPDGNGIDFCGEIRRQTDAHILFLTSLAEHKDRIRGLDIGGDDYITKPYKLAEMLSRVRAAMRRRDMDAAKPPARAVALGSLTLDTFTGTACFGGEDIPLKTKEFAVLRLLAENAGRLFTAEEIYRTVWGLEPNGDTRTVKVHISALRKKLRMDTQCELELEMEQRKHYVLRHNVNLCNQ